MLPVVPEAESLITKKVKKTFAKSIEALYYIHYFTYYDTSHVNIFSQNMELIKIAYILKKCI